MHPSRLEVMRHVEHVVEENLSNLLRDPEKAWQPSEFLPDLAAADGMEELHALRAEAEALPEDALVVLVGDMITEEALPTYASWISTLEGVGFQGDPKTAWGAWNRGWCAEENRHGDVLNRYLYLSGRVNMHEIEVTIHHLISDGGDTQTENDPYRTFIYTSFQEIATRISHLNVAKLAEKAGVERLAKLCRRVAGDEERHARAYKMFISKIIEVDPSEAVLAFHDMMRKKIVMPAMYMRERGGGVGETFEKFEVIANRTGVYGPLDYVGIIERLLEDWDIEHLGGLSPAAAKAQDYLCGLPAKYRRVIERLKMPKDADPVTFSWLDVPKVGELPTA